MKSYESDKLLREKILRGINTLAEYVGVSLGPKGKTVILQAKDKKPIVSKDGATIAKFTTFDDPFENSAAAILKQAAEETNVLAGDGTTTAIILARAITTEAQKYIAAGIAPIELKRGIDKAIERVVEELKSVSLPISDISDVEHIATISANNDSVIGKLVALAIDKVGKDGSVTIEEARSIDTTLDIMEGFRFDSGYIANSFITDERRGLVRHENAYILITDANIDSVEELMPVLTLVAKEAKPLILVASSIEGQALSALVLNAVRGTLKIAAIKAPRYGEERYNILSDLALATGATFVNADSPVSLSKVKLGDLGKIKTIEASKHSTVIVSDNSDEQLVTQRIDDLKSQLIGTEDLHEAERIQERITRLASGIAVIRVGGATEVEMTEKKHRVEDALEAVKSAQEEGIVAGGGITLLAMKNSLTKLKLAGDQKYGVEIISKILEEPIRQLAVNADKSPDLLIFQIKEQQKKKKNAGWGYDFLNDVFANMLEIGVIDPTKVTRCALQNAASAASTLILSNHCICEVD